MLQKLTGRWDVESSFKLASLTVALVTLYTLHVVQRSSGLGHYEIAGVHLQVFVLIHWIALGGFAALVIFDRFRDRPNRYAEKLAKSAALLLLAIAVLDIVWLVPNGEYVIVI